MTGPVHEHASPHNWLEFFAPSGWITQWYWPEGTHGKLWNVMHGKGWKVG